jgi:integrase/recombinase XerD
MERLNDVDLIKSFEKDCKMQNLTKGTIDTYRYVMNFFSEYLRKKGYNLLTVDKDILREYIPCMRDRNFTQKTIENHFSALSSFYDYIVFEEIIEKNVVKIVRKRYLKTYKTNDNGESQRKLVSILEMSRFINSILDIRDKACALLFAKTGIRRNELVAIDIDDINWDKMSILLKPTHKRSNRLVFFDYECAVILKRWLQKREEHADPENKALFVPYTNRKQRLKRSGVDNRFVKWATLTKLHNPNSDKIEEHFTPHCGRHWNSTFLRRAGMPREYIKWLRGDAITEALDIYLHIDPDEVRKTYLSCIPQLGII